jgi:hypothetical protein
MQYLKRNTKYSILVFFIILLTITISISTLAKIEVYFSLYDNPQLNTCPIPEVQNINNNNLFHNEFIKVLNISEPLAQKIIAFPFMSFPRMRESIILRDELNCFKEPKDLLKITELTNIDLREWEEEEINLTVIN